MKENKAKKKTKKDLNTKERQKGVILEDIDSKLDLVIEGHHSLDKKIDKNHQELQEFRNEVNYKFDVVFEKFDEVNDELRLIRNELKEKVGRDEFAVLEKRVVNLEKKISQKS